MQIKPLVSVLIVNYNNSSYINKCINSLNSQTYNNLEIIFFDDNSSDNSIDTIKKFSNVNIIENKVQTNFVLNQLKYLKEVIKKRRFNFFIRQDDYFDGEKARKQLINL